MRVFFTIIMFFFSPLLFSSDFGDLLPIPAVGDEWEVIRLDTKEITKIKILEASPSEVVKKMVSESGVYITKVKYSIEDGVCYLLSIESYNANNKTKYHQIISTTPATRCHIKKEEMPYRETYIREVRSPSGKLLGKEKRDRTYYFRGTEKIETPSGKYISEKIDVISKKMNRTEWRNENNSLIKHRVKIMKSGREVVTMLYKGQSK